MRGARQLALSLKDLASTTEEVSALRHSESTTVEDARVVAILMTSLSSLAGEWRLLLVEVVKVEDGERT